MASTTKICRGCGRDLPVEKFPRDRRLKSGRRGRCSECMNKYRLSPRRNTKRTGERRNVVRPSYPEKRARNRIGTEVAAGLRPHPDALPCADCGKMPDGTKGRRHEYDHIKGYAPPFDVVVESVCKIPCHKIRTRKREANDEALKDAVGF